MGNPHRRGTKKTAAKKKKAKPSPVPLDPADPTENNPAQITSTTENKCEENAKMAGPTGSPEKRRLLTTDGVHFNKFCMWVPDYTPKPEMARECSRYNDVDH